MKKFKLLNTLTILLALALCTATFTSCSDDDDIPGNFLDVDLDPASPDFVMPSSVELMDFIGMCEGENGTPQIFSRVSYKFSYTEYPDQVKYQETGLYSKVKYTSEPDENYTVGEKIDTEPAFEKIISSDIYYDATQDFVSRSYYNGEDLGKEEVTMRRFFRDFTIQTDMLDANYTFKIEMQLPIKVKTEPGLTTKEIVWTKEELNKMLWTQDYLGPDDWILDIDLTDPNIPKSTLYISLQVFYFDTWHVFSAPVKHFVYDPNKYN